MLDLNIILKSRFYYDVVTMVLFFLLSCYLEGSSGSLSWRILSGFHAGIEEPAALPRHAKGTAPQTLMWQTG